MDSITLPDATTATVLRSMSWGEIVIILLLVALVFIEVYKLWRQH